MGSIVSLLKSIYEQKEKVILGILILSFAGVSYIQLKAKRDSNANGGNGGENPNTVINDGWKPKPQRNPNAYEIPDLKNKLPIGEYLALIIDKRDPFEEPKSEDKDKDKKEESEWVDIKVKSVFDPTQSGSYIAIIEVDTRSRIVKEGQLFEGLEVLRIDGVRRCLTISSKTKEEKEFCEE